MKAVLFACLLIVAGVSAFPQDVELDVATPDQGRIADQWIINRVQLLIHWIRYRGYDPYNMPEHKFVETIIDGRVFMKGSFRNLKIEGLSGIYINYCYYNIFLGRLDLDIVLANLRASVDTFVAEVRYGDIGGTAEWSGSLALSGIRLVGNALLSLFPGQAPTILNISTHVTVDNIEADLEVNVKTLDSDEAIAVTEIVNNFFNVRVPDWLYTNKELLGTIVGEAIRWAVNQGPWFRF